jgi:hypothetical protein
MLLNSDPGTEYATETILATMDAPQRDQHEPRHSQHVSADPTPQQA